MKTWIVIFRVDKNSPNLVGKMKKKTIRLLDKKPSNLSKKLRR